MIFKSGLSIILLISAVHGCAEGDCDEFITDSDWQFRNNPNSFTRQLLRVPPRENYRDENFSGSLERFKPKRAQGPLSSDVVYEPVLNNAGLSRLRQFIRNAEKSHDFPARSNRAESKENYHLQASYIPRLG